MPPASITPATNFRVYYNDNDPYVVAWLRRLIAAGAVSDGDVDDRDIRDVRAADVAGYDQCHWFAGIGGWPLALALAGWGGDPVWTGSCPCQPFSVIGRRAGDADPRHLWPVWHQLIAERRPPIIFGEQVASKSGRAWLAGVRADLEALGYAVGAADLCAASVSAPHIRQRLWFVADRDSRGWSDQSASRLHDQGASGNDTVGRGRSGELGVAISARLEGYAGHGDGCDQPGWLEADADRPAAASPWGDLWLICSDGKARRSVPGLRLLAHGVPKRVAKLRALGNAIVPQIAAAFVRAYLDIRG